MLSYPKISQVCIPFFILIICLSLHGSSIGTDVITCCVPVRDPQSIVSSKQVFKLGFYTPANTTNRYLTISYVVSEKTVVWVANRDKPLKDASGFVAMSEEGNLVLVNGENEVVWSTNITSRNDQLTSNTTAQILDSGNLILYDNSSKVIWESFSHPSHIWLPTMPLIDDTRTGSKLMISSWRNESDPAIGSFKAGIQAMNIPQFFVWHSDGTPYFRSGQWNGQIFIGAQGMYGSSYSIGLSIVEFSPGVFHAMVTLHTDHLMMLLLNSSGSKINMVWNGQSKNWNSWSISPQNECDVYGKCGAFGVCDVKKSPTICSCMRGFEPMNIEEWNRRNWTSGCVRKTQLQCNNNNTRRKEKVGFLRLRYMKVPDFAEQFKSTNEEECRIKCLQNCSCVAYAHDPFAIGCMFWMEREGMIDTQQFPGFGVDLHVRLAASELDNNKAGILIVAIPVIGVTIFTLVLIVLARCLISKKKGGKTKELDSSKTNETFPSNSTVVFLHDVSERSVNIEQLPFFDLDTIAIATNQFHIGNLLGKGGFGNVYKGKLENGKEIAVKRLSETSRQGIEEFTNEVLVISKLQHKNLVRLIGFCVEKEEKMLVYEYMPNKSLDVCLFDLSYPSRKILDWKRRLNILKGIVRGLLYLHKDSRLRIIHRDLKASNVLLDQEWEPKISDFGMARIFETNQDQANTIRVAGTFGYMAPEYATEGRFSEKSDVYSFGVLMLEIISGKKNTHYCNDDSSLSLLGCAWKFFMEDNGVPFMDQDILNLHSKEEMVRCVHIALLCVQEFAKDRPTVQTVLSMLEGEIVHLPMPQQPVFAEKWNSTYESTKQIEYSVNELTITELDGR